jgi:hypothetical protein
MISGIGNSSSYLSSLFGTNGTGSSNASSSLSQTEEELFASIDTDGSGGISQSEFSSFLNKTAAAAGDNTSQTQAANSLFSQMSGGSSSISLQQFQANAGDLVTQLQSEIAAGSASSTSGSSSTSSTTSALLSQLTQSAQTLAAGSAAGIANASNSSSTSNTNNTSNSTGHHHHHGHGGGSSLISQFLQQYQSTGATSATATSTISASA